MSNVVGIANVKQIEYTAKVIRCGCTEEQKQQPDWHGHTNSVCPNPKDTKDLGVIAFYSRNVFVKWYKTLIRTVRRYL